ncbi:hypothetical protein [Chryseobacterium hagamense]|uniref:Uncharacterized protein n=1 Tax=Chryseobacterium hagamense TaxID=395935 RepID=A0A511YRM6_9FLAO|nr:hypothetical protein [Chryseobacterium hagamense]GEN77841.1 hypothetical protein CHA01nite_35810 [Chryseobacterium hagamense]
MKKNILFIFLLFSALSTAQVGIGTPSPVEKLEVNGSVAVGQSVTIDPTAYVNNPAGFTILGTDPSSATVGGKVLSIETLYTPLIVQPYSISNIYRDDLNDVNLNIPTDKYFITIANFEAIPSAGNNGIYSPVANPDTNSNRGHFTIRVFPSGQNWHVNIGYPTLNTQNTTDRYTYNFDIIIYSKRFFKDLGTINVNFNGSNNASATAAPSGI